MAAIENLEIIVDVDIASALAALQELQEELRDLAESIEGVDIAGTDGIDVETRLDDLDTELAAVKAEMEAFEATNTLNIDTDVDHRQLGILRGVMRDAVSDATTAGIADSVSDLGDGGGGGGFNRPFMASGSRAAARMPRVSAGMDSLFGSRRNTLFARLRRQVGRLTDTFDDFDLRMSDMHNMLARLIPLLLVFIGVLPAAITAIVGLAAAAIAAAASLAAIAGFGAMGVGLVDGQFDMERLTDLLSDARDMFIDAFAPLANELEPLFMDAFNSLGRFFQAIADQGDALLALTDEAEAFGGFLMDFLPGALRTLAATVEALSYLFGDFGRWLDQNFNQVMMDLTTMTAQATPFIAALIMRLGQAIPFLVDMSIGFTMVANAILQVAGIIGTLLDLIGIGAQTFGVIIASVLAFASALSLANLVMGTFVSTTIIGAITALHGFWLGLLNANSALTYLAGTTIVSALTSVYTFITSLLAGEVALFSFGSAAFTATGALAAFLTLATLGAATALVGVAISASSEFLGLAGSIDSATSSLQDFQSVSQGASDQFGGSGDNPYGFDPEDPRLQPGNGGGTSVFNVESGGDPEEDRSNIEYADWLSGRTSGG